VLSIVIGDVVRVVRIASETPAGRYRLPRETAAMARAVVQWHIFAVKQPTSRATLLVLAARARRKVVAAHQWYLEWQPQMW
jgi:hypothetical protein